MVDGEYNKKEFVDVLIVYAELSGDGDKYTFIDKIRQIDSKIKIIIIAVDEETFIGLYSVKVSSSTTK